MAKRATISKRLTIGFSCVLVVLVLCGVQAFLGIRRIVVNAKEVVYGNSPDAIMAQKEVDHLNWVGHVSDLLTDDTVTELHVPTDDHKCGFGEWLYGQAHAEAEAQAERVLKHITMAQLHVIGQQFGRVIQADQDLVAKREEAAQTFERTAALATAQA